MQSESLLMNECSVEGLISADQGEKLETISSTDKLLLRKVTFLETGAYKQLISSIKYLIILIR